MLYDAYYEELEHYAEKEGSFTLGLKGQMLQRADDLMKNDGKKFLEVMEKVRLIRLDPNRFQIRPIQSNPIESLTEAIH